MHGIDARILPAGHERRQVGGVREEAKDGDARVGDPLAGCEVVAHLCFTVQDAATANGGRFWGLLTGWSFAWRLFIGRQSASIYPEENGAVKDKKTRNGRGISSYDRWLMVIGAAKVAEALLFVLLGVGVIQLLQRGVVDELTRLILALRFDPEGRVASAVLNHAATMSPHRLKEISAVAFAHGALDLLEGVGLILTKVWAEFVTVAVSGFFLPLELYSLTRHVTWMRVTITVINLAVVAYLGFHLWMRYRVREENGGRCRGDSLVG